MNTSLQLQGSSLIDLLINKYYSTSFRPLFIVTSFFTIGYIADANQYLITVFIYFLCVYALFVFSIYKLLRELFSLTEINNKQKLLLICFANLFFTCIYFFTTEKIEIFGWYCASTIYLLPIAITCFSSWILIKKQSKKTDYFFLFLCALLIAGAAEHVPASVIASIGAVAIVLLVEKRKDKVFFKENRRQIFKVIFFAGTLIVFFILFVTNPGLWSHYNDAQADVMKNPEQNRILFFETLIMFCKPTKLIGLFLLVSGWILFFNTFKKEQIKKKIKYFLAVFIAVVFVAVLTGAFAYNSLTVGRVWFVADVSFFVLISALIIKYASQLKINSKFLMACSGSVLVILLLFDIRHITNLLHFSSEHAKIVSYLRQQDSGKVIVIERFPLPDLTNQVVLSSDPDSGENQLFCRFYNIKAKVSVKK